MQRTTSSSTRSRRLRCAGLAVAVVLLPACSDGGSQTADVQQLAATYCEAFLGWADAVEEQFEANSEVFDDLEAQFGDDVEAQVLTEVQEVVIDGLDGFRSSTTDVVDQLEDLDAPETAGARELLTQTISVFDRTATAIDGFRDRAESLDPADGGAFVAGMAQISTDVQVDLSSLFAELEEVEGVLEGSELAAAFEDEPACNAL